MPTLGSLEQLVSGEGWGIGEIHPVLTFALYGGDDSSGRGEGPGAQRQPWALLSFLVNDLHNTTITNTTARSHQGH